MNRTVFEQTKELAGILMTGYPNAIHTGYFFM